MHRTLALGALPLLLSLTSVAQAKVVYVSKSTGKKGNPGTKDAPKRLLWKAINGLAKGDTLRVAEGVYHGKRKLGVMPKLTVSDITIEGGWKTDFSTRDPFKHLSIIVAAPDRQGSSAEVFQCEGPTGITLDGFCIDRGQGNYYVKEGEIGANNKIPGHVDNSAWGYRTLNRKKSGSDPSIELLGRGKFTVRNMLIVNSPWWGIYVKAGGDTVIENNLVLIGQSRGIEVIPWGAGSTFTIRNNTVAFLHNLEGRALSLDPRRGSKYVVERNVLAFGDQSGIMTKFAAKGDALTLQNNLLFFFKEADVGAGGKALANVADFEDELEIVEEGNVHELPKFVAKLSQAWVDRYTQRKGLLGQHTTEAELKATRALVKLGDWKLAGFPKPFSSYKQLPDSPPNYRQSRYPHPVKKGDPPMDWAKWVLPVIGADGPRGIQPFKPTK